MSVIDKNSCRFCLSPDSAFVDVFGSFQQRNVERIVNSACNLELNRNINIPQFICEACMSKLLAVEVFKDICSRNEKFLSELAEVSEIEPENAQQQQLDTKTVKRQSEPCSQDISQCIELDSIQDEQQKTQTVLPTLFCSYCFQEFSSRVKCLYHERMKHRVRPSKDNAKSFICDRCGKNFKTKSIIHNHLNVVHLRIKRYQCNVCGFAMYSKTHHKNHSKTHTNTKDFKCSQCAKEFIRKESLVVHLRSHSHVRPYACKICDQTFTAHTDIKRHMFLHTNIHPYNCELCNKGFFMKRLLIDHVNESHRGVETTSWLTGKTSHNFKMSDKRQSSNS